MPRIYTEIRISHKTEEEKQDFKSKLAADANSHNLSVTDYIRMLVMNTNLEINVNLKGGSKNE